MLISLLSSFRSHLYFSSAPFLFMPYVFVSKLTLHDAVVGKEVEFVHMFAVPVMINGEGGVDLTP